MDSVSVKTIQVNAAVYSLVEDNRRNLWLATVQDGLFRFDPSMRELKNYREEDGLQGDVFTCAAKTSTGEILLGGRDGFNIFNPENISDNPVAPRVAITNFGLLDAKDARLRVNPGQEFSHFQNYFDVEFAVLDFTEPSKNRLLYRLEPDTNWRDLGHQRATILSNLAPASYDLQLKGTNNDGKWSDATASFAFTINPHFTDTWWFRLVIAACIVGGIAGIYRFRIRQLLRMEEMRSRIALDLHDVVGTTMSGIGLRIDIAKTRFAKGSKEFDHLDAAASDSRITAQKLRDFVSIINPEHDSSLDFVEGMRRAASDVLVKIPYTFTTSDAFPESLDPEFRWNLMLMFREIMHNIVKHARATRVEISLASADGLLSLRVVDNGVGFDLESDKIRGGNGLISLERRSEKMGGKIEFVSSVGNGAEVAFGAKIPRSRYGADSFFGVFWRGPHFAGEALQFLQSLLKKGG
jgi:hypothetical protein